MDARWLAPSYQLIGELLLHPDDRDPARINPTLKCLEHEALPELDPLRAFFSAPAAWSREEYVQTVELSPPCPLYLGAYLFGEPTTCRGVGTSGRNAYMLELAGIYRHFGFTLAGRELPDYLPVLVEFLGLSLGREGRDGIGLRRRLLEQHVRPALPPMRERLLTYRSPYAFLLEALGSTVAEDIRYLGDAPAWTPEPRPGLRGRSLPVLAQVERGTSRPVEVQP